MGDIQHCNTSSIKAWTCIDFIFEINVFALLTLIIDSFVDQNIKWACYIFSEEQSHLNLRQPLINGTGILKTSQMKNHFLVA